MDFNRARGKLYDLALARDVVRPLACDLYGRETRWNLFSLLDREKPEPQRVTW